MEGDAVDNDHVQEALQQLLRLHEEVQSRPKNEGVTSDYANPGRYNQGHRHIRRNSREDKEKVSHTMGDKARRGDEQTPEITSMIPLKCRETKHDELYRIVEGNGRKGGDDIFLDWVL